MYLSATFLPAADAALDRLRALRAGDRGLLAASALALLSLLALTLLPAPRAAAAACPNEAFRAGSPQLADCRAYEMVSPTDMNGNGIEQAFTIGADGNGVVYGSLNAFGEAQSSITAKWVARRSAAGWSSASLNPVTGSRVPTAYDQPVVMAAASDLSRILVGSRYPFSPLDQAPYMSFVNPGNADVYRVSAGNTSEWISHGPVLPDTTQLDRALGGASADLSRIFFETAEPLTPEAAGSAEVNLYERSEAGLRSVNVDEGALIAGGARIGRGQSPNASFYPGQFGGGNNAQGQPVDATAVSADGGVVFFTAPIEPETAPRQVYASVDGEIAIASECHAGACDGLPAPSGALFLVAPDDGSAVLFFSADALTATAPATGGIYRFDTGSGELSFVTAVGTAGVGFNTGGLLAASSDGAYLYLCENGTEVTVFHAGQLTPVAAVPCSAGSGESGFAEPTALRAGEEVAGVVGIKQGEPHITPAAGYVFGTTAQIGAYENGGKAEVYLWEAATAELRCLSCRADGSPPQRDSYLNNEVVIESGRIPTPVSSGIPVQNLSSSGERAFFVSEEALLPGDLNAVQDVYQWSRLGSGECTPANAGYSAAAAGCLSLVSSGRDPRGAVLEGASPSGDDVFFSSYQALVPADTGTELQLYDARVGGGLTVQHQVPPVGCGEEEGCRGDQPDAGGIAPKAGSTGVGGGNVDERCAELGARSSRLERQLKNLRGRAQMLRHRQPRRAKHLDRRAKRIAKRAGRVGKWAGQCHAAAEGAGR